MDKAISSITTQIIEKYYPDAIILFGSRAQGTGRADSNIDLCIVMNTTDKRHKSLIVERILNYGDEDAYRWMFKTYADEIIISVVKSNRRINKKAAVMMANFYNIPREDLACMKNVSVLG